jgi:MarR family transcriptional regulator, lower aerobic nicotinate degradation pathway regulator
VDVEIAPARLRALASWLLGQAALEAQRVGNDRLGAVGANRPQYALLAALDEVEHASQAELGRRLGIDPGDMVRLAGALAAEGWLARQPDPADRRRNLVAITPAGRRRLATLDAVVAQMQDDLLVPLTAAQRQQLVDLLTRIVDAQKHSDLRA